MTVKVDKRRKRAKEHYVNNREFSEALVEYLSAVKDVENDEDIDDIPMIPQYIGECIVKICEGLSHKPNFIDYSYRDEMVADGIENCLSKLHNFDIDRETRTGLPNAFAYFTTIAFNAFIRRIKKEKKQQEIKYALMEDGSDSDFITCSDDAPSYQNNSVTRARSLYEDCYS